MRKHGLTVDNLRAVDLITAEGERMRVDADGEPELFWGLRGGGGNFGIATSFEYDLHPVGPMVLGGPIFWPLSEAPEVLRFLRDFAPDAPDELGISIVMRLAPPMPFLPAEQYGKPVLGLLLVWAGDIGEGMKAVAPLAAIGTPLANVVRPVPYVALQSMLDGSAPHGNHCCLRRSPDTAGRPQGPLRPEQPLPAQRQHRAEWRRRTMTVLVTGATRRGLRRRRLHPPRAGGRRPRPALLGRRPGQGGQRGCGDRACRRHSCTPAST